ncbi:MAG: prolipoprotein diacylglyceryl transferase, partial [Oscillospiraceae bacterium]|nr:prolipoprotein diacylglyceryl transferase [Oscillospiraceae bacterium]
MYNTLFTIGPFSIRGYGLMIAIGILAAYYVAEKRAANFGLQSNKILSLVMWCLLGGMAGAKLLYLVVSFEDIKNSTDVLRTISNGFVVYG